MCGALARVLTSAKKGGLARPGSMSARLVLLTDGNPFGARLLEGCAARGVRFDAVVRETRADFASCLEDARARGRAGVLGALGRWVVRGRRLAPYAALCRAAGARFVKTGPRNGPAMLADLGALAPEWLILGGIGILAPPLLATARRGVLNAHPGLLPWIRGTGVVGRALERGVAIGATTHLVNAGVDTGDVVERRLLAVTGEERSLAALEERADALAVSMLVDLVVTL